MYYNSEFGDYDFSELEREIDRRLAELTPENFADEEEWESLSDDTYGETDHYEVEVCETNGYDEQIAQLISLELLEPVEVVLDMLHSLPWTLPFQSISLGDAMRISSGINLLGGLAHAVVVIKQLDEPPLI